MLTEAEEIELLELLEKEEREKVAPKLEVFREPHRFKITHGGRGSSKSWGIASLLVQRANTEQIKVLCAREIQKSIHESVYALIKQTVERLGYDGWIFQADTIISPCGSKFVFRGLKDLRAANQIKSYEGFDIVWIEEAATVPMSAWKIITPTFRKEGSEIWASFNRDEELDPVYEYFCVNQRPDTVVVEMNWDDNPWFPEVLRREMEHDYKTDPDEAEHIWGGQPRKQGHKSVMSRASIRGAMDREIDDTGQIVIGADIARYGDDKIVFYKRKGLKVIDKKKFARQGIPETARELWAFAGMDPSVPIKIDDTGVGGGVSDLLHEWGAKVMAVNFGGTADDEDKFGNIVSEMWFTFPIDEADIPNDNELMKQLSGRQYSFDRKNRRIIEPKADYKKRIGYSPDDADALILCFYEPANIDLSMDAKIALAARRRR